MRLTKMSLFVTCAAAATLAWANAGVLLRHEFKADATDVYNITMSMDQKITIPSMGDQDMNMKSTMKYTLKYGAPGTDGKAPLKMTISDMDMKMDGSMGDMSGMMGQMPKEMVISGKIDKRNRLSDMKAEGQAGMAAMMSGANNAMIGMFVEFPEKEVNAGDEWEIVLPKNPMTGNLEAKLTAKLIGEREENGVNCYVITLGGKIPMKMDMAEMMKNQPGADQMGGMEMVISGTIDLKAAAFVEKATGKTIKMDNVMDMKQQMEMKAMNMTMDMNGKMKFLMALKR